jgi:NAD(P)H-flavin reductase
MPFIRPCPATPLARRFHLFFDSATKSIISSNAANTACRSSPIIFRCWIKGPFPSPYSQVSSYDNQILVASGIGITPALAAINAFKASRRINLIWAVRDSAVLE